MMTRITIVVPFHNAERTIEQCLQSAVQESETGIDVIAIDDGSTDASLAKARCFAPAIQIVGGPNQGVSAARNRGVAKTKSEWIVFLDSDDLLLPGTLRMRLNAAETADADVVICDWQLLIDRGGDIVDGPIKSVDMAALATDAESACASHLWATTAALMYRRSLVERIGGFRHDLPVIQDARFLFDAAYHGARFAYSPHVGARYRVSPESLSRRNPGRFWRDILLNGMQIEALWRARGAPSPRQCAVLGDIYNGAAHGLFRAADPTFRTALSALRTARLPISRRNCLAEALSNVAGQRVAVRLADAWTRSRHSIARASWGWKVLRLSLHG